MGSKPVSAPTPDPSLLAQQQAAQNQNVETLQQGLSSQSLALLRQFGNINSAMGRPGVPAPMSTVAGGFSTPLVTSNGALLSTFSSAQGGKK